MIILVNSPSATEMPHAYVLYPLNIVRCPFCKASVYAVEFRGVKTKEEKGLEQLVSAALPWTIVIAWINEGCLCWLM